MKTRKNGVYVALAAVLLLSAVLVTNCIETLEGGYLKLNVGEGYTEGRTIMPTYASVGVAPFVRYEVTIRQGPVATETIFFATAAFANTGAISSGSFGALTDGTRYRITVDAFTTHSGTVGDPANVLAATGEYIIGSATTGANNVTVALKPTGTGVGTFTYNLSYDGSVDFSSLATATLGIYTDLAGTIPAPTLPTGTFTPVTLGTTGAGSVATLGTGTYYVKVSLAGAAGTQSATYVEVLQIYQGFTSAWGAAGAGNAHNFPALQSNSHSVSFNNTNGEGTNQANIPYAHAAALSTNGAINTLLTGSTPTPTGAFTGYTFNGWFTDSGYTAGNIIDIDSNPSTTDWNISTYKVFRPQTLYAQWVPPAGSGTIGTWTVSFSLSDVGGGNLGLTAGSLSQNITFDDLLGTGSVTLTVNPAGLISPTYQWLYNGAPLPTNNTTTTFVFDYVSSNTATEDYLRAGVHTITLLLTSDGVEYSQNFTITVQY